MTHDRPHDSAVPRARADTLADAVPFPSFATYVERCLYDPTFGYYASGKIALSPGGHFGTYPQLLRPLFGHVVAEAARVLLAAVDDSAAVPDDIPFTVLELGGGDGTLADGTLSYVAGRSETPRWRGLASRLRYVVGEMSAALRRRQRTALAAHIRAGRAEVRAVDARRLDWEGPFYGLVVANELLDAFPCERLRIHAPGRASRVHVVPLVDAAVATDRGLPTVEGAPTEFLDDGTVALPGEALWTLLADESADPGTQCTFAELEVPLDLGWVDADGSPGTPPAELLAYLESMRGMVADLGVCDDLPVDLHASVGLPGFVAAVGDLLTGPDRAGAAILVDYGGTTRHVLDPSSLGPHIRVYGPDVERTHGSAVYRDPSEYDITWDVDFTEVGRLATEAGVPPRFFGHQSALATPLRVQGLDDSLAEMRAAIRAGGVDDPDLARAMVDQRIALFRDAPGFRAVVLGSDEVDYGGWFGPSDDLDGPGLYTLSTGVTRDDLESELAAAGVPVDVADALHPCGDVVADLSDAGYYSHRHEVRSLLDREGWLVAPGDLAAPE